MGLGRQKTLDVCSLYVLKDASSLPLLGPMLQHMRRLHPRGAANRGICVDADGAMLGPDCVLVGRVGHTEQGFRPLERERASAVQKCALNDAPGEDWLFRQCQRISDALNKGEVALAQIYGLRIPVAELNDQRLEHLASTGITKWDFNPAEPRIPKGDPRGGEWTTGDDGSERSAFSADVTPTSDTGRDGGGGTVTLDALSDAVSTDSSLPTDDASSNTNGSPEPDDSGMQYQFVGPTSGAAAFPSVGTTAAADAATTTFMGPLSPETLAGLAELTAQIAAPTLFLGILFIPTNGSPVVDSAVAGAPWLTASYNADTGVVQVWRDGGPLGAPILLDTGHIGVDGLFYDQNGAAIGRALPNGAIVDPDTLPGYRSQTSAGPARTGVQALSDTAAEPKLCPDEGPDQPGARPKDIEYQQYISMLVNGRVLPPGVAINLVNPVTGNVVHFDDCELTTGTMIDAKGTGYADQLRYPGPQQGIDAWFLNEAGRQSSAAGSRPIEWYFAEEATADHVQELFTRNGISIRVTYIPWIK